MATAAVRAKSARSNPVPAWTPPPALPHPDTMPDQYATICHGNCLEPLIADRSCLVFDKNAEYKNGDIVVIIRRPEFVRPGENPGMVKRLVMRANVYLPFDAAPGSEVVPIIVAEMLNPPRRMFFKATELLAIHKCVGLATSDGSGMATWNPAQELEW